MIVQAKSSIGYDCVAVLSSLFTDGVKETTWDRPTYAAFIAWLEKEHGAIVQFGHKPKRTTMSSNFYADLSANDLAYWNWKTITFKDDGTVSMLLLKAAS